MKLFGAFVKLRKVTVRPSPHLDTKSRDSVSRLSSDCFETLSLDCI